jgi:DNA-binding MarR family transcriptional regulator
MLAEKFPCYCASLRQATRALTIVYDEHLQAAGVRATQFAILQTLEFKRGARIRDLESLLTMDQTTLTRNLAVLARRRLIEVVERPSGREKCWGVTLAGKAVIAIANPLWEKAQLEVRSRLGVRRTLALHDEIFNLTASFS